MVIRGTKCTCNRIEREMQGITDLPFLACLHSLLVKLSIIDICLNVIFLTLKAPEKLQLYGLYVYYVVHICDFGMLRVKI